MKISNKQKEENREQIIQAAVDIIIEKGFKAATMRAIARKAGLGDATIYNYFPTKDSILFAYYEDKAVQAGESLDEIEGFLDFTFQEKMEAYIEAGLEGFLPDREFLQETFRSVFFALPLSGKELMEIKTRFLGPVNTIFEEAIEKGEIEAPPFQEVTNHFIWDYYLGIVVYWLKDTSQQFTDTTSLINKTLDLGCASLRAGIPAKLFDIVSFLFRNHILSHLQCFQGNFDTFHQIKRELMGQGHGRKDSGKQA